MEVHAYNPSIWEMGGGEDNRIMNAYLDSMASTV